MENPILPALPERKKLSIWSIFKIFLGVGLIVFLLSKTSFSELVGLAAEVNWNWLWVTFGLFILLSLLKAWQYHILFDANFSYLQILSVVILQNAISNFVASSAGIAAYMAALRSEQGVKVSRSASVFVITKVGDLIAIWLGLIFSLLFVWQQISGILNLVLFLIFFIGMGLAAFGAIIFLRRRFVDFVSDIIDKLGLSKFRLIKQLLDLADKLADFNQKDVIRIMITAGSLSLLYLVLTLAWTYSSLHTFNLPIMISAVVFVTSMLQLLSIIPVQVFGGLGVSEVASLYFFELFGFSQGQLATVLIGIRLLFYLTNLAVLIYLPLYPLFQNRSSGKTG
jgi:uncharacterized membrane protein YbhN (UPF0104 family)